MPVPNLARTSCVRASQKRLLIALVKNAVNRFKYVKVEAAQDPIALYPVWLQLAVKICAKKSTQNGMGVVASALIALVKLLRKLSWNVANAKNACVKQTFKATI